MWDGSNFSGGGMGPHRGMPERSIRDWRREVLPPRELQMLDRHPADFPGRQPPSGFQGRGDSFGMQLEHIERERGPPFEMGPRRGPSFGPRNMRGIEDALLDFMGGDAHVSIVRGRPGMDLRGRDMPARDFGMQNQPFVEQRGWDGPAAEYRGRDVQPHNFRDFGPPSPEFRGPDMTSLDFRARDATPGGYRGRDISPGSYGGQDIPSDFRGRSFPSEFRGRDASSQEFRRWEGPRSEFSGNEAPSSEYRGRDVSSHDFRDVTHEARRSTPPHEFGDHDASHSSRAVDKLASEEDKDLSKTQTVDSLDSERNLSDYRVSGVSATDLPERERSPINTSGIDATDSDFRNHERLSSDFSADDMHSDTVASAETSIGTESREQPVLDSRNRGASSSSDSKLEEQTSGLSECSGKREESLEFLGREDADYRGRNYQDVDLRVPGMFDYRHGKSSDDPTKSDLDLKDQDYRTSSRDEKKSTCIMIDGLPRKATANDVLNAFKNPDGSTMSGFRLANLSTGYSHGFAYVEFSHLEEAVRCMEANQKNLTICGKRVSMRYSDPPVEWTCKYCEKINGPNRERCTNCDTKKSEALAGHSSAESSRHSKGHDRRQESERETAKKPSKQSESQQESKSSSKSEKESWHRTSTPPRHSPVRETQSPTSTRATSQHTSETAEDPSKSIIIKNISQSTTVNTILKALDPYAYLVKENIRIITSKRSGGNRGYAFVEMDSPKEAEHLVSILQKMNSAFTIAGRVVSVEVAKSSRRAPSSTVPDETYADETASTSQTRKDKQGSPQHTSNKAATRKSSPEVDRSSSPIGPEDATYLYDATSGFYYDPRTGLYFDPKSEYHYDAEKKQYLTWDAEEKKYIPVPNESEEEPKAKKSSPSRTRRRSSSPRSGKRSSSPRGRRRSSSPRGRRRSASPRAGRSTSPRTSDTASPRTRDTTSPRGKREKKNSSQDKRASTRPERTKSAERERRENRERKDLKTLQEQQVARDLERWASALEKQKPATRTSPRASRLEADDTKELKDFDDVFVKPERPISVPPSANKRDDLFKKPPTPPPPPPPPPPTPVTILVKKKKKNQAELKQKTSSFINLLAEYGSGSEEEEEEEEEEVEVVVEEVTPPVVPQPVTQQKQQNLPEQQTVPKQQPQPQKHGDDEKLTDWEKLACLLCRRQFPTKEGLIRHQQLSDLHKQNLAIHCQIKMSQQELEYLEQKEREVKGKKRPALKKERALETASLAPTEKKRVKYASDMEEEIWPSDVGRSGEGKQFGTGSTSEGKAGGAKGRSGTASSYRDAVRKAMFARFKELD